MGDTGEEWESIMRDYITPVRRAGALAAPHIGHKFHLCDMAETGAITLNEMKNLVRDPKFICRVCGRAAAREENLCEPVPL